MDFEPIFKGLWLKRQLLAAAGILFVIFLVFPGNVQGFSEHQESRFKHFSLSNGLPDLTIRTIFQDEFGFLWIGTESGLVKYDGYEMVTYRPEPGKPNTISDDKILAVCEGKNGNLWIGTENGGVNRFDRKTERFYSHSSSSARFLHRDKVGYIWSITNEYDVEKMNPETPEVNKILREAKSSDGWGILNTLNKVVKLQVSGMEFYAFHEDNMGVIWIGTYEGLKYYDPQKETEGLISADIPNENEKDFKIRDICEDKEKILWVGTESGRLMYYDRESDNFITKFDKNSAPWKGNPIWKLYPDKKGRLWVTTPNGLYAFEQKVLNSRNAHDYLHYFDDNSENKPHLSHNVSVPIHDDEEGRLWLISWASKGGIDLLDPENDAINPINGNLGGSKTLSQNGSVISSICKDHSGTLWIGTLEKGLFKKLERAFFGVPHFVHENDSNSLGNNQVNIIYESPSSPGTFWIGTEDGLAKFVMGNKNFTQYPHTPENSKNLIHNKVRAICEDKSGTLWIGTGGIIVEGSSSKGIQGGFYRYAPDKKEFINYPLNPGTSRRPNNIWVTVIYKSSEETLWIGTRYNGLFLFDPKTRRTKKPFIHNLEEPSSLSSNEIGVIYEDKIGNLWVGTFNGGLNRIIRRGKITIKSYPLSKIRPATVTAIYEDQYENFWIGTAKDGLQLFNREKGETEKYFTVKEGLPNGSINSILEDKEGYLWIITDEVLSKFDPAPGEQKFIRLYDTSDGLRISRFSTAWKNVKGEFFIGGNNGFCVFSPNKIGKNTALPRVVLTGFKIFDKPVNIGDDSPLKQAISVTDKIVLSHDQNDISFDIAVIHFTRPDRNKSKYKLVSCDKEWRDAGSSRRANYNNLSPGKYTFKVKGTNCDGVWSSKTKSVKIIIKPPFTGTLYFYIFLGLSSVGLLWAGYKFRVRRLLAKQREKHLKDANKNLEIAVARRTEGLKKQSTALRKALNSLKKAQHQLVSKEKMAALGELSTNIAHEIKNPLNFVVNFAKLSIDLSEELLEKLKSDKSALKSPKLSNIDEILNDLKQNLTRIRQHGSRINKIVTEIRLHARGEKRELKPVDLNTFIKENTNLAYQNVLAEDPSVDVKIEYDLDDSIGSVLIVPQSFSRALLNVIINAFYAVNEKRKKASPQFKSLVKVKTEKSGEEFKIHIWDNGDGISKRDIENIFEPFFTTKPMEEGTGLGLSMARDIIKRGHKGKIEARSEEKKFAEFIITIPFHLKIENLIQDTADT